MHPVKRYSRSEYFRCNICRSNFLLVLLLLLLVSNTWLFVASAVRSDKADPQIQLISNLGLDKRIPEGQDLTLTCTKLGRPTISADGLGRNGGLRILRRRCNRVVGGSGVDGFEDMASVASVRHLGPGDMDIACTFTVSRQDDGATFICGEADTLGFATQGSISTASIVVYVQFNPRSLSLQSYPPGGMREDSIKVITCKLDEGGANPPLNITWKHLSPLGALESVTETMQTTQESWPARKGGYITQANMTLNVHRRLNGHRIECGVENIQRMLLFRQTEILEVLFAPNSVQIHSTPANGVKEGEMLLLTCSVSVSYPPATVHWYEFPNVAHDMNEPRREITDIAQIEMTAGEYGGMLVDSTLRVSRTFRSNAQTEYRCIVHQTALKSPVTREHKLSVFYPPAVEIISLPTDPSEGLSVTLSCLAHGGNPTEHLQFSWWYVKRLQLSNEPENKELDSIVAKTLVSALNTSEFETLFSQMERLPSGSGRHLLLDSVGVENIGWYGCEVSNIGGSARSMHLLTINYAPRLAEDTKFVQHAQLGFPIEFRASVNLRPVRAEVVWYRIGGDVAVVNRARQQILAQYSALRGSMNHPESTLLSGTGVLRRLSRASETVGYRVGEANYPLKAITPESPPWTGRVKQNTNIKVPDEITFALRFREVVIADFGIYMCQVSHRSGTREFLFELKPKSTAKVIDAESIKISSEGRIARVEFMPPGNQFYSRILLRICLLRSLKSRIHSNEGAIASSEFEFLKPEEERKRYIATGTNDALQRNPDSEKSRETIIGSTDGECVDYHVAMAELGYLQVDIDRPINDYTFQFLVYRNAELKQVTQAVRSSSGLIHQPTTNQKMFIQLIIGILTTVIGICLLILLVYYICTLTKRRGNKKRTTDAANGFHKGPLVYQTLDPSKGFQTSTSMPGSISADLGSLQPLYPHQSIGSVGKGYFISPNAPISPSTMMESSFQMQRSASAASQMSALTQRIISEVYMAAAKAASIAVSESIASGSIDGVNLRSDGIAPDGDRRSAIGTVGPGCAYRPGSHYAESGSINGSMSGIEALTSYPGEHIGGTLRSSGFPSNGLSDTMSQRSNNTRYRKSPVVRTGTPSSGQVFHFGQSRRPSIASSTGGSGGHWSTSLTPSVARRLNEAASALAAAATAAVLEANQSQPAACENSTCPQTQAHPHIPRFGPNSATMQTTSSEDGESINSHSFSQKRMAHEANPSAKTSRKKLLKNVRRMSLTNGGDSLLPMLNVPVSYGCSIQDNHKIDSFSRPPEMISFIPASLLAGGPWAQKFRPIQVDDVSIKSSPYSDLTNDITLTTFASNGQLSGTSQSAPMQNSNQVNAPTPNGNTIKTQLPVTNLTVPESI